MVRFLVLVVSVLFYANATFADHLPAVDPLQSDTDHSHENHDGHDETTGRIGLNNITLSDASFVDANVSSLRFTNSDLSRVAFDSAKGRYVTFENTDLSNASFQNADFASSHIRNATLSGVNMRGINLAGADLRGLDWSTTDLSGAILNGANLANGDLSQVTFDASTSYDAFTRFPVGFNPAANGLSLIPRRGYGDAIIGKFAFTSTTRSAADLAYEPSTDSLLIAQGDVRRYTTTGTFVEEIQTDFNVQGLAVLPGGEWLIYDTSQEVLATVDATSGATLTSVSLPIDEFEVLTYDEGTDTAVIQFNEEFYRRYNLDGTVASEIVRGGSETTLEYDASSEMLYSLSNTRRDQPAFGIFRTNRDGEQFAGLELEATFVDLDDSEFFGLAIDSENQRGFALLWVEDIDEFQQVWTIDLTAVPEPNATVMLLTGLLSLATLRKHRALQN